MDPCFGEEIVSTLEAATKFDGTHIRQLATLGGRGELEGDAPAGLRKRLDGDASTIGSLAWLQTRIDQAKAAKAEPLKLRSAADKKILHAEYVAETVRQMVFAQYGQETYTRGLNVYTTVQSAEQMAAYKALRQGIMDFERRQIYRGPEKFIDLPADDLLDRAVLVHRQPGQGVAGALQQFGAARGDGQPRRGTDVLSISGAQRTLLQGSHGVAVRRAGHTCRNRSRGRGTYRWRRNT